MSWLVNPYMLGAGLYAYGGEVSYIISGNDLYALHSFTASAPSSLTISKGSGTIEYLIVGGGGGGGGSGGGGGGAGAVISGSVDLEVGSYSVIVANGGAGGASASYGKDGGTTTFHTFNAIGGGGGGNFYDGPYGRNGACGGGGGNGTSEVDYAGGIGSVGFNGGAGRHRSGRYLTGGGGGGMGQAGTGGHGTATAGTSGIAGAGGNGITSSITGSSVYYGGGGGGGANLDGLQPFEGGYAGLGGGARGGGTNGAPSQATPNRGGGGGGGRWSAGAYEAGTAGGSGVVYLRYKVQELTFVASGGTMAYSFNGNDINVTHTYTSSGSSPFTVSKGSSNVQYLVVGGGGGAGGTQNSISIGGDGGQVLEGTTLITSSQTINIGAGGTPGPGWSTTVSSTSGGDSSIGSLVVAAGGKGGANTLFSGTGQSTLGTGGTNKSAAGLSPGAGVTSNLSGSAVVYGTTYANAALDTTPAARANNTGDGGQPVWSNASRSGGAGGSGIVIIKYNIEITQKYQAVGGSTLSSGGYTYHIFDTAGTYSFTSIDNAVHAQVLIIGGGGAGGTGEDWGGGGGGAGGVRVWSPLSFAPNNSYQIIVGSGGVPSPNATAIGGSGGTSSVVHLNGTLAAAGGGGGGASWSINDGANGGSGGGGSFDGNGTGGIANGIGIGNNGGNGSTNGLNWRAGGGGGGYSAAGLTPTGSTGGTGGQGYSVGADLVSILGATHTVVASGGGGGHQFGGALDALGGTGAGNAGTSPTAGSSYGSGGGGGRYAVGGAGKSGIVIIRYRTSP